MQSTTRVRDLVRAQHMTAKSGKLSSLPGIPVATSRLTYGPHPSLQIQPALESTQEGTSSVSVHASQQDDGVCLADNIVVDSESVQRVNSSICALTGAFAF